MASLFALELAAVVLALVYVVLAIRQRRSCFCAASLSAMLYTVIFAKAQLYMEAALQIFYIAMAAYGWFVWGQQQSPEERPVTRWPLIRHGWLIIAVVSIAAVTGALLSRYTDAALPFADSLTTVAALVATWMVARKILENWLWWIAIDLLSIWLYVERELTTTAILFAGYVVLALAGYLAWRQTLVQPESAFR
jgi:nicotinamide mononucleotide transporter